MVRSSLSDDVISASKAFVQQIDALGMNPQGAIWVYDHLVEYWAFYLATSLIETIGPAETFDLLIEAEKKLGLPLGFDADDIRLRDPSDPLMQALSALGETSADGLARFRDQSFDGERYDVVILRRLGAEPSAKQSRAIGRRFARNVKALRQAAE